MPSKKQHRETQRLKIQRYLEDAFQTFVLCLDGSYGFSCKGIVFEFRKDREGWVALCRDPRQPVHQPFRKANKDKVEKKLIIGPADTWKIAAKQLRTYLLLIPNKSGEILWVSTPYTTKN